MERDLDDYDLTDIIIHLSPTCAKCDNENCKMMDKINHLLDHLREMYDDLNPDCIRINTESKTAIVLGSPLELDDCTDDVPYWTEIKTKSGSLIFVSMTPVEEMAAEHQMAYQ